MKKDYDSKRVMKTLSYAIIIGIAASFSVMVFFVIFSGGTKGYKTEFYFLNVQTGQWDTEIGEISREDYGISVQEVLDKIKEGPKSPGLLKSVPEQISAEARYIREERRAEIFFSNEYYELSASDALTLRASVVMTVTELDFIDDVVLYAGDSELTRPNGQPLGVLDKASFLASHNVTTEERKIILYFADHSTTGLTAEERVIEADPNLPIQQYILEELIKGPSNPELYRIIPADTKVISVKRDISICYVDFSAEFLNKFHGGSGVEALLVYSIVNSLTEPQNNQNGIQRVQIFVEGEKTKELLSIDLTKPFERLEELITPMSRD